MADSGIVLTGILQTISDIADEESQKRWWLSVESNQFDSPDEIFCRFFDDYNVDYFIDNDCLRAPNVSREQCLMLAKFRDALNEYGHSHGVHLPPEKLLADPKWHQICRMAREVIAKFGK